MSRLKKEEWWLQLAEIAAKRSEDPYCKVGAVAIRPDGSIAAVSYNGAPSKIEIDWSDRNKRRQFVVHAETNLLRYIKPHECPNVAVTLAPCYDCLKNLASYGIKNVFFKDLYDKCDFEDLKQMANLYKISLYKYELNQTYNIILTNV